MRKVIWAIAIVFCVQVAFQLAMTADRTDMSYAELRTPLQTGINGPSPSLTADDLDTNIALVGPEDTGTDAASPIPTRVLIRYIRVPDRSRPALARQASTATFKPVIITYDRTGALTQASTASAERKAFTRQESEPDDKRSLIAKVVTKPYDWLKAVGSKLR